MGKVTGTEKVGKAEARIHEQIPIPVYAPGGRSPMMHIPCQETPHLTRRLSSAADPSIYQSRSQNPPSPQSQEQ